MDSDHNPWAAHKPIDQVTDSDVADLVEATRCRGTPALARNCLVKVRTMFAWAMAPDRRRGFGLRQNPSRTSHRGC
ncbi:phage integrase central domain-containing protein [Sinorhizobium meliloti]|uniref:phage integrase central domain-containing protein n=1 Tax=Rhizobium meliloti TaxID=382 RepID=UPI0039864EDD